MKAVADKKKDTGAFVVCPHGSTYCFCRHNLEAAKYDLPKGWYRSKGAHKTGRKGKMRKRQHDTSKLVAEIRAK